MRTEPLEKPHEAFLNIGLTLAHKIAYYTLRALDKTHQIGNTRLDEYEQQGLISINQYTQSINQETSNTSSDGSLKKIIGATLVPAGVVMGMGAIGFMIGAKILGAGAASILKSANHRFGEQVDDINQEKK